ncbi:MAG: hypothetical protein RBT30_01985 [Patescibacteria group bacterium]|jgi:hypothetical protein|nr:hypothetical protein [Patescibacteria group bacterium]
MINSIFSTQKKLIYIASRDSSRDRRLLRAKYDKLMRSRQILLWVR